MAHKCFAVGNDEWNNETDPDFHFAVGMKYSDERAMAAAAKSFRFAAEQGHADAQFHLGALYAQGHEGAPKSFSDANYWFRRAAMRGHQLAAESSEYLEKHILATGKSERNIDTLASYSDVPNSKKVSNWKV